MTSSRFGSAFDEEPVACVPLRAAEGVLGALALGFVEPGDFSPEFQRDLESFCAHAATALARTTGRRQLEFLDTASARLGASLDVLETLDAIGRLAATSWHGDRPASFATRAHIQSCG